MRLVVLVSSIALTSAAAYATPIDDATYDTIIGSCIGQMDTGPAQNASGGLKYESCKCSADEVRSTISLEEAKAFFNANRAAGSPDPFAPIVKDCVRKNTKN